MKLSIKNLDPEVYPIIAQNLPLRDVSNFSLACSDNFKNMNLMPVWADLAKRDFSDLLTLSEKPKDVSWKDFYKFCHHLNSLEYKKYESYTKAFQTAYKTLPKAGLIIDKGLIVAGSLVSIPTVIALSFLTHTAIYLTSLACLGISLGHVIKKLPTDPNLTPLPIKLGLIGGALIGFIAIVYTSQKLVKNDSITFAIVDKLMPPTRSISVIFHRVFSNDYVRKGISHTFGAINALKTRIFSRRA